jgi:hypothetical protein
MTDSTSTKAWSLRRWLANLSVRDRAVGAATVGAGALTALMLYLEASHEPYHVDELRQVRSYYGSAMNVVNASFAQDQPPLDKLVGAQFGFFLGTGDIPNRASSMVAGLGVVAILIVLLWRSRVRVGVPVTVAVLAVTPTFLSFTAYARPYALPLFLILLHAAMSDSWLRNGDKIVALRLAAVAMLLPLSRVFEPPAYLVLVTVTVFVYRRWWRPEWGARVWWIAASTTAALLAVELPVFRRLQDQLSAYQGDDGAASLSEQWDRVINDSLPRFATVFENGWLALLLVMFALTRAGVRRRLFELWWFWPVTAAAGSFAVAFHYRTLPGQPFYSRYGYFWLVSFAIVVGLLVDDTVERRAWRTPGTWIAGALVGAMAVSLTVGVVDDLSTADRTDYRALGELIEAEYPDTVDVIFDTVAYPLGKWRPGYAGYGRYTADARQMIKAEILHFRPETIVDGQDYLIATAGPILDVEGWEPVVASHNLTLYVPDQYPATVSEVAAALIDFGRATQPLQGAVLRIAGALVFVNVGELGAGCAEIDALIAEDPAITQKVATSVERSQLAEDFASCPGGNPLS